MAWMPQAAILWALAYGSVRVWWAVHGAPSFGRLGTDLIVFTGWRAVGLCAAAAGVALALRTARWRRPLLVARPVYSRAFWWVRLPSLIGVGGAARAFCGRTGIRMRPAQPPWWAWWAAYAAVAGSLARLGAQVAVGFGFMRHAPGSFWVFEAGFVLSGTVPPLALVHSWDGVVPRWVPRWLPLGPAFGIGGALTVYFGVSMLKLTADTLSGTWDPGPSLFRWGSSGLPCPPTGCGA
jgi:hypothetical protein